MSKHKFTPLPRDLVMILRTEARNQRTPPVEYVIAEDGGRMVHRPEPDIAMAELLEEAAAALAEKNNENERLKVELGETLLVLEQTERNAEPAPAARSGSVKVKQLGWVELNEGKVFRALLPVIGSIRIEPYGVCGWWEVLWSMPGQCDKLIPDVFDTPDEAKAAAQADYDQRVLSAIEPAEKAQEAQPVAYRNAIDHTYISPTHYNQIKLGKSTYQPLYTLPESHLREVLKAAADRLERLAFAIPPPNAHTPELMSLAIGMRQAALAQEDGE